MKIKFLLILIVFFLVGCQMTEEQMQERAMETQDVFEDKESLDGDWRNTPLIDVSTGKEFKISDLDKPILLESFAVWCPICRQQQDKIKELHDELGDGMISVSIDTDPNEDASKVQGHIDKYGYDWLFAVAPIEMTQSLIDEFGLRIVNAPGAPVILICPDSSAKLLARGVKSASDLRAEIDRC